MAKQNRPIIWEVTIDFISFYKRCGVGCVRMKSNLTAERWRKDPAFEGSRKSAARMALASQLGSSFYQTIPQQHRYYPHYKQLVGVAQHMLCRGYNIKQVNKVLRFAVARYLRKLHATDPDRKPERSPFAATLSLKAKPAFTSIIPQQLAAPQFTTITVSKPAIIPGSVIIAPRGSPKTIIGDTHQTGNVSAVTCHFSGSTSCKSQPFPMAGLVMSLHVNSAHPFLKQPSKQRLHHKKNTFKNKFLSIAIKIFP